ncbi:MULTISPECIES: hypothetical protein [unclassified Streptomyces]|nr:MULTISPECIES: hypothetical protein [unclassified Streptomyces]MCX5327886.1 hypothetical protein [Streptomyces sp. NBC_00140]MCX5357374.1 hypothetical protein [Streptomyces sp. NBC_00124]
MSINATAVVLNLVDQERTLALLRTYGDTITSSLAQSVRIRRPSTRA